MKNKTNWNKELLYSFIFFTTAILVLFLDPLNEIEKFLFALPNATEIKIRLLTSGLYPSFNMITDSMILLFLFFLICSIYAGVKSLRKSLLLNTRKLFNYIPISIPICLAFIQVLISALLVTLVLIEFVLL